MSGHRDFRLTFRHARAVAWVFLGAFLVVYALSGLYSVRPEELGIVKRFGRVETDAVPPGIHRHWPWPVESVTRLDVSTVRALTVTFTRARDSGGLRGYLLTGDQNVVGAAFKVNYTVKEPVKYLYTTRDIDGLLTRVVESAALQTVGHMSVDDALTGGRNRLRSEVRNRAQAACDEYDLGVRILAVHLEKLTPPSEVEDAFKNVASARGNKQKLVRQAQGERNREIPNARAEANRVMRDAEAYAEEAVSMAEGDADRFLSAYSEYRKTPGVTAFRMYLETIEQVLPRVKKHIADPDAEKHMFPGMRGD